MESDRKSLAIKQKFKWKFDEEGWVCHGSPPHTFAQKIIDKAPEVYLMIDRGQPYRYIAQMLQISEHTIGRLVKWRSKPLISRQQFGVLFPGWQNMPKDEVRAITADAVVARFLAAQEAA